MPAQYVFEPQRNQNEDLDQLMTGLVQNVAYRRAQQARKFATAQDMATKMATGLIPKANITVTDEGYEFADEGNTGSDLAGTSLKHGDKRKAFYKAVGGMMGNEDMDQEGGTDTTASPIADEAEWNQQVNAGLYAQQNPRGLDQSEQNFNNASSLLTNLVDGQPRTPTNTNANVQNALRGALNLAPQPAPQVPSVVPTPYTNAGQQVAPQMPVAPVQAIVGPGGNINSSSKEMHVDEVDVQLETPGIDISRDQYAQFQTTKKSERMDNIKTSYMNLMGLSALEGYDNQQMRVGDLNSGAPVNDTFQNIAKQRLADIARWEAAATEDGTVQDVKKIGTRQLKTTAVTQALNIKREGSQANQTRIGDDNRGSGTNPTAGKRKVDNIAGGKTEIAVVDGKFNEDVSAIPINVNTITNFKRGADLVNHIVDLSSTEEWKGYKIVPMDSSGRPVPQGTDPHQVVVTAPNGKKAVLSYRNHRSGGTTANKTGYQGWSGSFEKGFPLNYAQHVMNVSID